MTDQRPLVGAHVPVAGGIARRGLPYAADVGAEAIQVFVSSPRTWATPTGDPDQDAAVRRHQIPVYVHASYLINLGSADPTTSARSAAALDHALRRGREIGARGVVVHTGSAVGSEVPTALRRVADVLLPLLDGLTDSDPDLLLEPMAGQGRMLCAEVSDLPGYLENLRRHPKARVCLDTCHLYAAGHDLAAPGGPAAMLATFADLVGVDRVALVHANDSAGDCGSRTDRHAGIGDGRIGTEPFRDLLHHPALAHVPFLVETPGGKDGHARDIATLATLRDGAGLATLRDSAGLATLRDGEAVG